MKRDEMFIQIADVFQKRNSAFAELFFELFFFGGIFEQAESLGLVESKRVLIDSYTIEADISVPGFRRLLDRIITRALRALEGTPEIGDTVEQLRREHGDLAEDKSYQLGPEQRRQLLAEWLALAGRVADLRHDLIEVKSIKLVDAKAALDRTISGATMEAYGNGIINGKNQAERDLQIAAYLDKDKAVQTAKLSVRHWETQLAGIEARLEMVEAEYKAAWAKLSAARAAAALQTSYLQFLTAQADIEAEPTAEAYEHPF